VGTPPALAYDLVMYVLATLLGAGLLANALIRPLGPKWFTPEDAAAALRSSQATITSTAYSDRVGNSGLGARVMLAWLSVGFPISWGVWMTLTKTAVLFDVHVGAPW
jgi:hypothetical protein